MKTDSPPETTIGLPTSACREGLRRIRISGRFDRRIASEGAWLVAGQGVTAGATLIGVRLLTEAMPPEVYGAVNLLLGVLALGRNLFCLPFYQAALRYYPELALQGEVGRLRRIIVHDLGRSTFFLAGLLALVSVPLLWGQPRSLLLVPLLVGLLVMDNLCWMELSLLTAARRQRTFSIIRACEACFRPAAAILMILWLGAAPYVVLLGYLAAEVALYAGFYLFRVERIGATTPSDRADAPRSLGSSDRELRGRIWRFGLPLVPIAILEWTSGLGDRYIIGGLRGLEAAGTYIAAYGLISQPFLMVQAVLELLCRPIYYDSISADDDRRVRSIFRAWIAATAILCTLGVVAVVLLSEDIARLCLAGPYQSAHRLFPWIAAGYSMLALSYVFERAFHAWQKTGYCLLVRCFGAITSIVVGVPLIILWGARGAACAVPIYFGFQLALCIFIFRSRGGEG